MEDRNIYPQNTAASDLIGTDEHGRRYYKSNPKIFESIKKVRRAKGLFGFRIVRKSDLDNLCFYTNMLVLYRQNLLEIQLLQNQLGRAQDIINGKPVLNVIDPR